jgi:hypothetical protein
MSNFDQLILSINSRIGHEKDLAFSKNNGEIANKIRAKFLAGADIERTPRVWNIALDDDGDIAIQIDVGSWYVTEDNLFLAGLVTTQAGLTEGTCGNEVASVAELLIEERRAFRPRSYEVGVLFTARFFPPVLTALGSQYAATLFDSIFRVRMPGDVSSFRVSSSFSTEPFSDSVELETSRRELQLRYSRQAPAAKFESYRDFFNSAQMGSVIASFQPFIEPLVADNSKLRGRVFKQMPQDSDFEAQGPGKSVK